MGLKPFRDEHDTEVRLARTEKAIEKLKRRASIGRSDITRIDGQEILEASSSIGSGATGVASWAKATTTPTLDTLLDLTTPNSPTPIADGRYELLCQFDSGATAVEVGEAVKVQFVVNLGAGGGIEIPLLYTFSPSVAGSGEEMLIPIGISWKLTTASVIQASVINGTARTLDIAYRLYVQALD